MELMSLILHSIIYLIDHAWTFRVQDVRSHLTQMPGLLARMTALMEISEENRTKEELIEAVFAEMWRYNQTYNFGHFERGSEESMPLWYILDEFGSRIRHSDEPSFRAIPFYHAPTQLTYTILWPLRNCEAGDEVTRDFVPTVMGSITSEKRTARLLPWFPADMTHISYTQTEPGDEYFLEYKQGEILPTEPGSLRDLRHLEVIKVFIDYSLFSTHLTDPRFVIVEDPQEADIIWSLKTWKDFKTLSEAAPPKIINQFPNEQVLTIKDLLAIISRRAAHITDVDNDDDDDGGVGGPRWLPQTYNLATELPAFVSYFQQREEKGLDNHWICKPWNLARGLDIHITDNLHYILRLPESGPKVACKYLEDPVLFHRPEVGGVKFDIRYVVMLSGVKPLQLYVYDVFWLRFANKEFSLDHLDDYEKHFTVMNYAEDAPVKQIHYDEFIPMFEHQHSLHKWEDIQKDIFQMIRELFQCATEGSYPRAIPESPVSRAMYAIDLMLTWTHKGTEREMQPMLCEVNFMPDCERACKYHPDFVNDVFSTLFLADVKDRPVNQL